MSAANKKAAALAGANGHYNANTIDFNTNRAARHLLMALANLQKIQITTAQSIGLLNILTADLELALARIEEVANG